MYVFGYIAQISWSELVPHQQFEVCFTLFYMIAEVAQLCTKIYFGVKGNISSTKAKKYAIHIWF